MTIQTIRQAYGEQLLGARQSGFITNPDQVGQRQEFEKGLIYYHERRDVGGFVPYGPIWEFWRMYGYERGDLGYPTSTTPPPIVPGGFIGSSFIQTSTFEGGTVTTVFDAFYRPPLKVLWYNTALMIWPFYKLGDRDANLRRLIEILKAGDWDVICLGEVFYDDERRQIRRALANTHPHWIAGPDEADLEQDGGLLLLSRYSFTKSGQTIFRATDGEDSLANKGILHARVRVSAPPSSSSDSGSEGHSIDGWIYGSGTYYVDLFATHMQAGAQTGTKADSDSARRKQAEHAASYVAAVTEQKIPGVLLGDLNMKFDSDATWYNSLGSPRDAWKLANHGVTPAALTTHNSRVDAILLYHGNDSIILPRSCKVLKFTKSPSSSSDLSDHHPIEAVFDPPTKLSFELTDLKQWGRRVHLVRAHALDTTNGPGADDTEIWLSDNGAQPKKWHLGEFDAGQLKQYKRNEKAIPSNVSNDVNLAFRAEEEDRPWSGPERIGTGTITASRELAQMMSNSYARRRTLPSPLFTGNGSQYAFQVGFSLVLLR